jgi:hypothetical protein
MEAAEPWGEKIIQLTIINSFKGEKSQEQQVTRSFVSLLSRETDEHPKHNIPPVFTIPSTWVQGCAFFRVIPDILQSVNDV